MTPATSTESSNGAGQRPPAYAEAPPSGRYGTFSSLRIRNFRYLWIGQISHAGALWMEQIARPFLVLAVTNGSATHVGGVIAVRTLPQLLFGVVAGVIADWFDRRLVLLVSRSVLLSLNILFAALILGDQLALWHIYAYAFVRGTVMAFDQPARTALIPSMVPEHRVTNAVALMSATQNTMRIAGAPLGGLAYAVLGAGGAFAMIATIYTGAVVFTFLLNVPTHERPSTSGLGAMGRGLIAGGRFALHHAAVRGVLLLSLVYFAFGMAYMQVFLPIFADDVLDIGSTGFGFMLSLTGGGALLAALYIANRQPERLGRTLSGLVVMLGAVLVAFALATYLSGPAGLVLPFALIAVAGAMQTSYFSLSRAMMLHAAPEEMRGRVVSLLSLDRGVMIIGAAAAGWLTDAAGVQPAQIIYGAISVAGGIAMFALAREFRRARTTYRLEQSPIEPAALRPAAADEAPPATEPARTAGGH